MSNEIDELAMKVRNATLDLLDDKQKEDTYTTGYAMWVAMQSICTPEVAANVIRDSSPIRQ